MIYLAYVAGVVLAVGLLVLAVGLIRGRRTEREPAQRWTVRPWGWSPKGSPPVRLPFIHQSAWKDCSPKSESKISHKDSLRVLEGDDPDRTSMESMPTCRGSEWIFRCMDKPPWEAAPVRRMTWRPASIRMSAGRSRSARSLLPLLDPEFSRDTATS
jgi:hypothetical protein